MEKAMVIFLINWRIKPDDSSITAFLSKWKTQLRIKNAEGLFGEFLSQVRDKTFFDFVTWDLREHADGEYRNYIRTDDFISYVNVGIWRSKEDFIKNIGSYMPPAPWTMEEFEAAPRRRAVVEPEHWRIGQFPLPTATSPGVEF
jgi:hypothetical protein